MLNRSTFWPIARIRTCSTPGCRRPTRSGGRTCQLCNAAAFRRWYKRHHQEVVSERCAATLERSDEQRVRDSARAKLAMAIRRGTIVRQPCIRCNDPKVIAYIPDPAAWREVVWLCRDCRPGEIARRTAPSEEEIAAARKAERTAALAGLAALTKAEREQLYVIAARGPGGLLLTPEAPLYTMQLVRAYKALMDSRKTVGLTKTGTYPQPLVASNE